MLVVKDMKEFVKTIDSCEKCPSHHKHNSDLIPNVKMECRYEKYRDIRKYPKQGYKHIYNKDLLNKFPCWCPLNNIKQEVNEV